MTTASLKVIPIRTQMTAVKAPTVLPRAAVHLHRELTLEPLLLPHTATAHSAAEQQET